MRRQIRSHRLAAQLLCATALSLSFGLAACGGGGGGATPSISPPPPPPPPPPPSPPPSKVYIAEADGTGVTRISDPLISDIGQIAYVSN